MMRHRSLATQFSTMKTIVQITVPSAAISIWQHEASILEFQFHRALCKEAGFTGPLNRCSLNGNKAAAAKRAKMLAMGESPRGMRHWKPSADHASMDASAILDYFAPLKKCLDEYNKGHNVGWN
jgi:peptidyl-dipeptidase A